MSLLLLLPPLLLLLPLPEPLPELLPELLQKDEYFDNLHDELLEPELELEPETEREPEPDLEPDPEPDPEPEEQLGPLEPDPDPDLELDPEPDPDPEEELDPPGVQLISTTLTVQSKAQFTSNGNPVRVLIDKYYCSNQSSCMTLRATRVTGAPAVNPCNSITALTCGSTGSFSLSGSGAWNPPGPWGTPGEEQVFSFTATLSGAHSISVTNSGYYVDLFIKSGSCSSSGWTFLDDIYLSGTSIVNLTAGVTYHLLIDDENTAG